MINVKGLFETLQHKANNIDSNTPTSEILDTLKAIKIHDGNTVVSYDSDGVLPDAATTNIKLAYLKDTGYFKFNNGTWDILTSELEGQLAPLFGGTISGYSAGGQQPALSNIVEKYSFVSDANATDVGDLPEARYSQQGVQSSTTGYVMGGRDPNANSETGIHKITFASDAVATGYSLSAGRQQLATNGVVSSSHGYAVGGSGSNQAAGETIDKFPFATDANATDVGDLLVGTADNASCHSDLINGYGYTAGGENAWSISPPGTTNLKLIQKFSTSSDGNAVDAVAELQFAKRRVGSNTSSSYGYITGGSKTGAPSNPPLTSYINEIEKFAFNSGAQATDVGDLTNGILRPGSSSSTASGYSHGGSSPSMINVIDKFPFSTDANSADVGDLTAVTSNNAGVHQ